MTTSQSERTAAAPALELAGKAALFREGARRIYEGQGDRADMWFFELWHFLGDVQAVLSTTTDGALTAVSNQERGDRPAPVTDARREEIARIIDEKVTAHCDDERCHCWLDGVEEAADAILALLSGTGNGRDGL